MNSFTTYQSGQLHTAITEALSEVKDQPSSLDHRVFLSELLCFSQDFERADKQLHIATTLDNKTALTLSIWRQLIRAAQIRFDVYHQNGTPELIDEPTEETSRGLSNLLARNTQQGDITLSPERKQSYVINGKTVDQWRDLDDLTGYSLEVLASNGKYFWVDMSQVAELSFHAPERPLDLLWRKASILLTKGSEGEVFIPTIYPYTPKDDNALMLGRETDWAEAKSHIEGHGLRTWLVGDEALPIMEIESIVLNQTDSSE